LIEVGNNQYIGMELALLQKMMLALSQIDDGETIHACVTKWMQDNEELSIGRARDNLLLAG
jgi:hypothetical protein